MSGSRLDIAIAGGGMSGGLLALALHRQRPDLAVVLFEQDEKLGGHRRRDWFAGELDPAGEDLLAGFRTVRWDNGHAVCFPGHTRTFATSYRSLGPADIDAALRRQLPAGTIHCRTRVETVDARGLTLANGTQVAARAVFDCRGFAASPDLTGAWLTFLGRHLRTDAPHGIARPVIMDSRIAQRDSCRFVRVLPLGAQELFVEVLDYASRPGADRRALGPVLEACCAGQGWTGEILGNEAGSVPLVSGGNIAAFQAARREPGVARVGGRGLFVDPLGGSGMALAVENALAVAAEADLPGEQIAALIEGRARAWWKRTALQRRFARQLLGPASAQLRHGLHAGLYRLPEAVVARFQARRSRGLDRLRIALSRPGAFALLAPFARPQPLAGEPPA